MRGVIVKLIEHKTLRSIEVIAAAKDTARDKVCLIKGTPPSVTALTAAARSRRRSPVTGHPDARVHRARLWRVFGRGARDAPGLGPAGTHPCCFFIFTLWDDGLTACAWAGVAVPGRLDVDDAAPHSQGDRRGGHLPPAHRARSAWPWVRLGLFQNV